MRDWLNSVYSDGTRHYVSNPFPKKGERIVIQIRMCENSEIREVFLRAREFGIEQLHPMKTFRRKNGLIYYACEVTVKDAVFHYQFYLVTDNQIYYYTQFRITDYIPDESNDFILLADYKAPDWVNRSVFYQIYPDRFFNGTPGISVKNGEYRYQGYETMQMKDWNTPAVDYEQGHNLDFYGGDLEGIIQKLDYLEQLGVNAIYLNPIFLSPSAHKYDSLDYFHVDPHLGGDEALEKLTGELHKRGMRLILDISINHTSSSGIWFNKENEFYESGVGAYQNPDSLERSFYFFDDKNGYDAWFGHSTMPKLNYGSSELRNIIYKNQNSVLRKWLREPYSIDGWRFDVADCLARNEIIDVHKEVLRELRANLKEEKKDAYLLAEDWADCSDDLQGDAWDSTMNYYGCARPVREFVGESDLFNARNDCLNKISTRLTASQLRKRILQFYAKMPSAIYHQMFNLLDSHDVTRLHNNPVINKQDYRGAVILQFTLPGSPCIYYGDEILLNGRISSVEGSRYPMDWESDRKDSVVDNYNLYHKLAMLKRNSAALQDGGFQVITEDHYCFSYARFTEEEVIIVICSVDQEERQVVLPIDHFGLLTFDEKQDYFSTPIQSKYENKRVTVTVKPHQSYLFVLPVIDQELK
jgi:alpha-glucosidase